MIVQGLLPLPIELLDVVAAHGVGGTVGALLTGVFADRSLNGLADGLLYGLLTAGTFGWLWP